MNMIGILPKEWICRFLAIITRRMIQAASLSCAGAGTPICCSATGSTITSIRKHLTIFPTSFLIPDKSTGYAICISRLIYIIHYKQKLRTEYDQIANLSIHDAAAKAALEYTTEIFFTRLHMHLSDSFLPIPAVVFVFFWPLGLLLTLPLPFHASAYPTTIPLPP